MNINNLKKMIEHINDIYYNEKDNDIIITCDVEEISVYYKGNLLLTYIAENLLKEIKDKEIKDKEIKDNE